jgi:site-specific DNA recombinase
MLLNMKGVFAEYELEKIRERTLRGRREKARQGFVVGGRVAFGYSYLGRAEGERGRLVVYEVEATVVRMVFTWADEGCSIREIVTRLNALGVKPKFAARWGKSSVFRLLKNETYIGQGYYNRRQRSRPSELSQKQRFRRNKKTLLRLRPESEWIPLPAPAIVDVAIFERVRVRLQQNRELRSGRPSTSYLLRSLCWCGECGRRLHGCPSHRKRYYRCSGRDRLAVPRCTAPPVHGEKLESSVWRAIADAFANARVLRAIIARNIEQFGKTADDGPQEADVQKRLDAVERKKAQLLRVIGDPDLSEHFDEFKRELSAVKGECQRIQIELLKLQRDRATATTPLGDVDSLCRAVRRAIAKADDATRAGFIQRLVQRITVKDKTAEILCAVPSMGGNRSQRVDDRPSGFRQNHARETLRGHSSAVDLSRIHRDHADPQRCRLAAARRRIAGPPSVSRAASYGFGCRPHRRRLRNTASRRSQPGA